jgi:hypothetical protein
MSGCREVIDVVEVFPNHNSYPMWLQVCCLSRLIVKRSCLYGEIFSICLWKISEVDVGGSTRCYVWHNVMSFACTRGTHYFQVGV